MDRQVSRGRCPLLPDCCAVSAALAALVVLAASGSSAGYEQQLVQRALAARHLTLDPHPDGKHVEEILVESENVFTPDGPWPVVLNVFHMQTREGILRREVLLAPGDTGVGWVPIAAAPRIETPADTP